MPHAAHRGGRLDLGWLWLLGALALSAGAAGCATTELPSGPPPLPLPPPTPDPVTEGPPAGTADPRAVAGRVRGRLDEIKRCYEKALRGNQAVAGKLVVHWSIAPDGWPFDVSIESSTVSDEDMVLCIARRISFWEFPPPHGGVVDVSYPFVFQAAR